MTLTEQQSPPRADETREQKPAVSEGGFRVQTGLRAGDVYMQSPRGSNNRLNGG